jgi:hypothetical protein
VKFTKTQRTAPHAHYLANKKIPNRLGAVDSPQREIATLGFQLPDPEKLHVNPVPRLGADGTVNNQPHAGGNHRTQATPPSGGWGRATAFNGSRALVFNTTSLCGGVSLQN